MKLLQKAAKERNSLAKVVLSEPEDREKFHACKDPGQTVREGRSRLKGRHRHPGRNKGRRGWNRDRGLGRKLAVSGHVDLLWD